MQSEKKNYQLLKKFALEKTGISLLGVAEVGSLKDSFRDISSSIREKLSLAISIAVHLLDPVIEDIEDHPTALYIHHYRQVNYWLDRASLAISEFIQSREWRALPIPASQIIDWNNLTGHFSHWEIAWRAGLGWRGRNNLLVHPRLGSRIRLASILTDFPLQVDSPLKRDCGDCRRCIPVCPVGAIKEDPEEFDLEACKGQIRLFKKKYNLPHYVCGICVKACGGTHGDGEKRTD